MTRVVEMTVKAPAPAAMPAPAAAPPVFELARTTAVYEAPDGAIAGIIRGKTRVAVVGEAPATRTCPTRWLELAPRGWACGTALAPTTEPASVDSGDDDDVMPGGVYGVVRADAVAYASADDAAAGENGRELTGANTVRAIGAATIDGRRFWRTSAGELIDASSIAAMSPSRFAGVALADGDAMPAWVWPRRARVRDGSGKLVGELAPRTVVHIAETSPDGRDVRIDDDRWVARRDLRVAAVTARPGDAGTGERWIDVDLDDQVLVAYEGERPVFATLVSTGKSQHETPALVARIESKHARAHMTATKQDVYSVADVPWTMYYDRGFALHTSYWHDGFGSPRSHGCVNLSPSDAHFLYRWSAPALPAGWIDAYGTAAHPGSIVRIRSRKVPEPTLVASAK